MLPPLNSSAVKAHAREVGFDGCGIAPVGPFPELAFLETWIRRGYAGTMTYLGRSARKRREVRAAEPTARSVIVTATVYNTDRPHTSERSSDTAAIVSRYAWGDDYHVIVRQRLDGLLEWMRAAHPDPFDARIYVDTGPIQERVYAQYAGLGWIGKNTCLIDPDLGSWLFLGCLITSLPLEPDGPGQDQCGDCEICLDACPTGALVGARELDARRCISYLTIEQRQQIPEAMRPLLGQLVYGCDICQDVCPWNRSAAVSARPEWGPRPDLDPADALRLWRLSDAALDALLQGTPMERVGAVRLRRNLAIALGNSGGISPDDLDGDADSARASIADPLVAEHVRWARARLAGRIDASGRRDTV